MTIRRPYHVIDLNVASIESLDQHVFTSYMCSFSCRWLVYKFYRLPSSVNGQCRFVKPGTYWYKTRYKTRRGKMEWNYMLKLLLVFWFQLCFFLYQDQHISILPFIHWWTVSVHIHRWIPLITAKIHRFSAFSPFENFSNSRKCIEFDRLGSSTFRRN